MGRSPDRKFEWVDVNEGDIAQALIANEDTTLNYFQATTLLPKLRTRRSALCAPRFRKYNPETSLLTKPYEARGRGWWVEGE